MALKWASRPSRATGGKTACFGAGVAVGRFSPASRPRVVSFAANKKPAAGHPLRKACFLLAANREGGPGFCRGAPLSYRSIGVLEKNFRNFWKIWNLSGWDALHGAVGTAFLDQPQRIQLDTSDSLTGIPSRTTRSGTKALCQLARHDSVTSFSHE
jgi:hypothetical protein